MAGDYFSGNVSFAGTVVAGTAPPTPTLAGMTYVRGFTSANGASQTAYTPAAGKTFYLYGCSNGTGGGTIGVFGQDGTTAMFQLVLTASGTAQGGALSSVNGGSCPIESYTNANPLKIQGTAGQSFHYYGVEI